MAFINPTNPILPRGRVGLPYTQDFSPVNPSSNLVSSTPVPPGLTMNTTNPKLFVLSGIPTQAGTFTFTVMGDGDFSTLYTLTIDARQPNQNTNLPNILLYTPPDGNFPSYLSYMRVTYTFNNIDINAQGVYTKGYRQIPTVPTYKIPANIDIPKTYSDANNQCKAAIANEASRQADQATSQEDLRRAGEYFLRGLNYCDETYPTSTHPTTGTGITTGPTPQNPLVLTSPYGDYPKVIFNKNEAYNLVNVTPERNAFYEREQSGTSKNNLLQGAISFGPTLHIQAPTPKPPAPPASESSNPTGLTKLEADSIVDEICTMMNISNANSIIKNSILVQRVYLMKNGYYLISKKGADGKVMCSAITSITTQSQADDIAHYYCDLYNSPRPYSKTLLDAIWQLYKFILNNKYVVAYKWDGNKTVCSLHK